MRSWPIDTTLRVLFCKNAARCSYPIDNIAMTDNDYVILFPIPGFKTQEKYFEAVKNDDSFQTISGTSSKFTKQTTWLLLVLQFLLMGSPILKSLLFCLVNS